MAKVEADKVEDNEELRKKLWLMIARNVILQGKATKGENIRKAIAFLKETDGLLKIEDILPFFPALIFLPAKSCAPGHPRPRACQGEVYAVHPPEHALSV